MKTYTPTLDPAALDRLVEYATLFADDFPQSKPARWAGVYLQGLRLDGERKSIEPLSHRVRLPQGLSSTDPEPGLQPFVNQSPWDHHAVLRRYRAHPAHTLASPDGIFRFDDVSFPEPGTHSVGVPRQYCGALGRKANGQVAVSVHYVSPKGHYPLDVRLYRPDSWLRDGKGLNKAGVPKDQGRSLTESEMAPELLDGVRAEGLPGRAVAADAGYGLSGPSRAGPEERGLTYIVGVSGAFVVLTGQPKWDRPTADQSGPGRPRARPQLAPSSPEPVTSSALALRLRRHRVGWREGTKGTLPGHFAWLRVWPAHGWKTGDGADEKPFWVRIEKPGDDGPLEFAFSNRPAGTSRITAVRLWKSRWPVEQGYQPLKDELGLDPFEGRSWRGFHHPTAMTLLAYGFLLLERHRLGAERDRAKSTRPERVEQGGAEPPLTLPGVRRALQPMLRPWAKPDCVYCQAQHLHPIQL